MKNELERLEEFIKNCGKASEIKRVLAVQNDVLGKPRPHIAVLLGVHPSFVSKWRIIYDEYGVEGLYSQHQGGSPRALLGNENLTAIYAHIRSHTVFGVNHFISSLSI